MTARNAMGLVLAFAVMIVSAPSASNAQSSINILVLGSTHSYSETGESGVVHEKAFDPTGIADELQRILEADPVIPEAVNVAVEDVYTTKTLATAFGQSGDLRDFNYRSFSLAQYFMWPEGRDARLSMLRGEAGTAWDYVVIMGDPYLMENLPGAYAEGVNMIAAEVAEGTARPLLLSQWPHGDTAYSADHFDEVAYRVGTSQGVPVIPGGFAWDTLAEKDTATEHPTPNGAYLAAAAIYSQIHDRSASESGYERDDAIADHALAAVRTRRDAVPYEGEFTFISPFSMSAVKKRRVTFNQTGSSSEGGIQQALIAAMNRSMVDHTRYGAPPWDDGVAPVDFNYGRGNSWFEANKRYKVDTALYDRSFGFPMQDQNATAATTMLYGIDKRYGYEDGTDLGIAFDMIREGELPSNARAIPIRLMWAKIHQAEPTLSPLRDAWHMSRVLDDASGTFMYTLISGRCPVDDEPADTESAAWDRWLGRKIGYETAWRMASLQARAPGFQVLPSSRKPEETSEFTVRFMYPPEKDVTVAVTVDQPSAVGVSPARLVFTPENHAAPQTVTVTGYVGADPDIEFNVSFDTTSEDAVFDALNDSWTVRVADPVEPPPAMSPTPTSGPVDPTPSSGPPTRVPPEATPTGTPFVPFWKAWLPVLER